MIGLALPHLAGLALALALLLCSLPANLASAYSEAELREAERLAGHVRPATNYLASDALEGRWPGTPGSALAQRYIIDQLTPFADGVFSGAATGDDAFLHPFTSGVNILGVIAGRQLPNEYVFVGAHYDHLGGSCTPTACNVFNGATDNAAGVAIVLAMARAIDSLPVPPRRSVVFALWDDEEPSLRGSLAYVDSVGPLLPLVKAYVNFDIQGSNLLPSLREMSFAIGAETGGFRLEESVASAIATQSLDTRQLSMVFGQDRSDHANFYHNGVPSVFFSDATGGCYHTRGDQIDVVDFEKLAEQSRIGFRLVADLAESPTTPGFSTLSSVVYEDAVVIGDILSATQAHLDLFSTQHQQTLGNLHDQFATRVANGPGAFTVADQFQTASAAEFLVDRFDQLECDGFLVPEPRAGVKCAASLVVIAWLRRSVRTRIVAGRSSIALNT